MSSCLPSDTGAKNKSKIEPFTYVIGLMAYSGTKETVVVEGKIDTVVHKDGDGVVLTPGTFTETAGILPVPAQTINVTSSGGGGGGTGDASNAKLDQVITAINDTIEDDETQTLLNSIVTESNDTQALITALQAAVDGATDEVQVTALGNLLAAVQDTTEDDQTQTGIANLLTEISDEGDETQTALATLLTGITTLTLQDQTEDDQTQVILSDILAFLQGHSGTEEVILQGYARTVDGVVTMPDVKSFLVKNTGTTTIKVNGMPIQPGESWTKEARNYTTLGTLTVEVDASPAIGTSNEYHIEAWGIQ